MQLRQSCPCWLIVRHVHFLSYSSVSTSYSSKCNQIPVGEILRPFRDVTSESRICARPQSTNCLVSRISCFELGTCVFSQSMCLRPANCALERLIPGCRTARASFLRSAPRATRNILTHHSYTCAARLVLNITSLYDCCAGEPGHHPLKPKLPKRCYGGLVHGGRGQEKAQRKGEGVLPFGRFSMPLFASD